MSTYPPQVGDGPEGLGGPHRDHRPVSVFRAPVGEWTYGVVVETPGATRSGRAFRTTDDSRPFVRTDFDWIKDLRFCPFPRHKLQM